MSQDTLRRLGAKIKRLRLLKRWTQLRLAVESEASSSYIGHIERGEKNPTYTMLIRLAKALEVEPKVFFD